MKLVPRGGYGLIDGKVADPDDFYHSFSLNATTYLGLKRTAEMIEGVDPEYAATLSDVLVDYRQNIRDAIIDAQARAPVVPLGDGTWAPLAPPWSEYCGGTTFFADGGKWYTHGAFASRSSLTGPLWLIIGEVLEADELAAEFLIKTNAYPVTLENAALSQPHYGRHDYAHLLRGEREAYLKAYYNQLTALHDQQTGTFWEHYYHASQHKTHEEAWFLLQTRWMLWLERGEELCLLSAVPRDWLLPGSVIGFERVHSYFGELSVKVEVQQGDGLRVEAEVRLKPRQRRPEAVTIRLAHPERLKVKKCSGGRYQSDSESVVLDATQKEWQVVLEWERQCGGGRTAVRGEL